MKNLRFHLLILFIIGAIQIALGATVETRMIFSNAMQKEIPATFTLPDEYHKNTAPYPVVYVLHGFGGDHTNWVNLTTIEKLADRYHIIIVCPDGSPDSWYFDSPLDSTSQYEAHVAAEVVSFTDIHFRTIKSRQGRAITGLSMGGHGALFLAIRHPDIFGAAGSMSGGVDIRLSAKKWNLGKKIGSLEEFPARWDSLSVLHLTGELQAGTLALIIDCGAADFFLEVNRQLHEKLLKAGITHDYIERPGGHNWAYWNTAIKYQLLFFSEFFSKRKL